MGSSVIPVLAMVAPTMLVFALHPRLNRSVLSPVRIIALLMGTTGIVGYLWRGLINGSEGGGVVLHLDEATARRTAYLFAGSLLAFAVGASAVCLAWLPRATHSRGPRLVLGERIRSVLLAATLLPGVLLVVGYGWHDLLERDQYLKEFTGTNVPSVASPLVLGSIIVLGMLQSIERRQGARVAGVLIFVALASIFFAIGTRQFAVAPSAFAFGNLVTSRSRSRWVWCVLGGLATIGLVPVVLYLRELPSHGLLPYLRMLGSFSYADVQWSRMLTNVFISFHITGTVAFGAERIPGDYLWIELNPLPGFLTNWYAIAPTLRLNEATPFSGLGELRNVGLVPLLAFWAAVGAAAGALERGVALTAQRGRNGIAIIVCGLTALFAYSIPQYNLRNSERLLLYAAVLLVGTALLDRRAGPLTPPASELGAPPPRSRTASSAR